MFGPIQRDPRIIFDGNILEQNIFETKYCKAMVSKVYLTSNVLPNIFDEFIQVKEVRQVIILQKIFEEKYKSEDKTNTHSGGAGGGSPLNYYPQSPIAGVHVCRGQQPPE